MDFPDDTAQNDRARIQSRAACHDRGHQQIDLQLALPFVGWPRPHSPFQRRKRRGPAPPWRTEHRADTGTFPDHAAPYGPRACGKRPRMPVAACAPPSSPKTGSGLAYAQDREPRRPSAHLAWLEVPVRPPRPDRGDPLRCAYYRARPDIGASFNSGFHAPVSSLPGELRTIDCVGASSSRRASAAPCIDGSSRRRLAC